MRKKITCIILAVLMLSILTGCRCKHEWKEATCSSPKVCSKCGENEGTVVAHVQGEWEVESEASYSEPGVQKAYCTLCGELLVEEEIYKQRIQDGLFIFSKQELVDMLDASLSEYSSKFLVMEYSEYIGVSYSSQVDYIMYFILNDSTVARKLNEPLNVDSLLVAFTGKNNHDIHIATLIECCHPEIDATKLEDTVKQIQDGKKVFLGDLSFITGTVEGFDALIINIEE